MPIDKQNVESAIAIEARSIELANDIERELVAVLEAMARQHCRMRSDGTIDSSGIAANAEALELLEAHGQ